MTQALAAFNEHGILLATDSLATRFDAAGRPEFFNVEKLFPLGRHSAVLSGGAGVSVPLSMALRQEISHRRGMDDIDDIVDFALSFLSQGYARYLHDHSPEPEGFRRIYFILAGYSPEKPPPGFSLVLVGSEDNELPLRLMSATNLVVMPRNLGMEMRLVNALTQGATLKEILDLCKEFLDKMAAATEEVGPPFYFAAINPEGYQPISI